MYPTTASVDLAKNVFQVAIADASGRVLEQRKRSDFTLWRGLVN